MTNQSKAALIQASNPNQSTQERHGADATAFILFEDFRAATQARTTCRDIRTQNWPSLVRENLWKVDMLRLPTLREVAAFEASKSDLVVIAINIHGAMTGPIRDWLHQWERHQTATAQGVLVLPRDRVASESAKPSEFCRLIQSMAVRTGWMLTMRGLDNDPDSLEVDRG